MSTQWAGLLRCYALLPQVEQLSGRTVNLEPSETTLRTDPLGSKPVYWSTASGKLVASRSLSGFKVKPDRLAAFQAMTVGFPIGRRSMLEGVNTLPPCTEACFRGAQQISEVVYWMPPKRLSDTLSVAASVTAISHAMDKSVGRLSGSVGLGLTGGHDSRVILNALRRSKVDFECLAWEEGNFNDQVAAELCRVIGKRLRKVQLDDEAELREVASSRTSGQASNVINYAALGRECLRAGIPTLLTGFSGDRISGSMTIPDPKHLDSVDKLADVALKNQMELLSFEEAEKLFGGTGSYTEQTLREWRESFREHEWRDTLQDVCIWQCIFNRNCKRVALRMLPADHFADVVHPFLDEGVLDVYFSLPLSHLQYQRAHCLAGCLATPAFGRLAACSYGIPLSLEPALAPALHWLRSTPLLRRVRANRKEKGERRDVRIRIWRAILEKFYFDRGYRLFEGLV